MSEAKKINEGTVTSLSDTDLVLASDSSGTLRPITVANLQKLFRDTLQIGGHNLLKDTGDYIINTSVTKWLSSKSVLTADQLNSEKALTLSCKYRKIGSPSGNVVIGATRTSDWWDQTIIDASLLKDSGTITKTFSSNSSATGFSLFAVCKEGVELYDFKLERGNVATDWTPAPEDLGWGGKRKIHNHLRFTLSRLAERRSA